MGKTLFGGVLLAVVIAALGEEGAETVAGELTMAPEIEEKDPFEGTVYNYPLNTPEAAAKRREELKELKALFHSTSSSGCPFANIQQQATWTNLLHLAPRTLEYLYFAAYRRLRAHEVAYILTFYSVVLVLIYRAFLRSRRLAVTSQSLTVQENSDFTYCESQLRADIANIVAQAGEGRTDLQRRIREVEHSLREMAADHIETTREVMESHGEMAAKIENLSGKSVQIKANVAPSPLL